MSEQNKLLCRYHRDHHEENASDHDDLTRTTFGTKLQQALSGVWEQCVQQSQSSAGPSSARSPGRRMAARHRRIASMPDSGILESLHNKDDIDTSSLQRELLLDGRRAAASNHHCDQDQEECAPPSLGESIRGLESSLVPEMVHNRRRVIAGVLSAQTNLAQTHVMMRTRVLSQTAAHLSAPSACFARTMAYLDATSHTTSDMEEQSSHHHHHHHHAPLSSSSHGHYEATTTANANANNNHKNVVVPFDFADLDMAQLMAAPLEQ